MKFCSQCEQANPDDATFCHRCGVEMKEEFEPSPSSSSSAEDSASNEETVWRTFIGSSQTLIFSLKNLLSFKNCWSIDSSDNYYIEQFKNFRTESTPQFALTWHWPAFLVPPFLWFLYRKMYLYAAVYFVGPSLAFFLTGDPTVTFIWQVIAGATANYLYFWHVQDHLKELSEQVGPNEPIPEEALHDVGGVQPYVFVLAILLHIFVLFLLVKGPPQAPTEQVPDGLQSESSRPL